MARILIQNEWFHELSPTALYESDFENIIKDLAPLIFPKFVIIPFKTKVYADEDIVIPDFALIDESYRGWWVVEVEMYYHSFDNHVLPQIIKLSQGNYGTDQANYLCEMLPKLDKAKVIDMMKGKSPQVLMIINKPMPEWSQILTRFNTIVCIVEIFRSDKNRHVFRVNGEYPSFPSNFLSDCTIDPLLPRFLIVESPANLPVNRGEKIKILYNNCQTEWERIDGSNKVWLSPIGMYPLPAKTSFRLIRQDSGEICLTKK